MHEIIIGYHNGIFLIPVVLSLALFVVVVVVVVVVAFWGTKDYRRIIFSESSPVYMGCSRTRSGHS